MIEDYEGQDFSQEKVIDELLSHENNDDGSRLKELMQVLPALSKGQVQSLIKELKANGKIFNIGNTRAALWYLGDADDIASGNSGSTQI